MDHKEAMHTAPTPITEKQARGQQSSPLPGISITGTVIKPHAAEIWHLHYSLDVAI